MSDATLELSKLKVELENLDESKAVQEYITDKLLEAEKKFEAQLGTVLQQNFILKEHLDGLNIKNKTLLDENALQKSLLDESTNKLDAKIQEVNSLAAQMSQTADDGIKRYSSDEVKEILRQIFVRSSEQFITTEDLDEIEDENLHIAIRKTSKSNLKRLREILSEISESSLN